MQLKHFALIALLCLATQATIAQHSNTSILLKGIDHLPLPDTPVYPLASYPVNSQSEIIATGKSFYSDLQLPTIVTGQFGKGKAMMLFADVYFKKPFLDTAAVQQFIGNVLTWSHSEKKTIGIYENQPQLKAYFESKHFKVSTVSKSISAKTGVIFILSDIKDSAQRAMMLSFIEKGGTVVFASPFPAIMAETRNEVMPEYALNDVLLKTGLYHPNSNFLKASSTGFLNILSEVPSYLYIDSILAYTQNGTYNKLIPQNGMTAAEAILRLVAAKADTGSICYKKLVETFSLNDTSTAYPSASHIIRKKSTKEFLGYQLKEITIQRNKKDGDYHFVHPAARSFPGEISKSAERINADISIGVHTGRNGLLEPDSAFKRWHSTGYYVPAGETVQIIVPSQLQKRALTAQIGSHDDNLYHMDYFSRSPNDLTSHFDLLKDTTVIYSQYGGLLYINIPDSTTLTNVAFKATGVVSAPYFLLGKTTDEEWNTIRNNPAPWAELATDKIILTVPSYRIRNLSNPTQLMQFWNEVMDADADLANIPHNRKHPERIIVDQQVSWGYMFTVEYKIVVPDDESCQWMLNESFMREKGSWGHFHELGHRHQFWGYDYDDLGEVTVNLYSMYVYDKVLHKGIYNHEAIASAENVNKSIKNYLANSPSYEKWKNDAFLQLGLYIKIVDAFGWQPIISLHKHFREIYDPKNMTRDDDNRRNNYFVALCEATGKDLSQYFEAWKIPITEDSKSKVKKYPSWMPDVML